MGAETSLTDDGTAWGSKEAAAMEDAAAGVETAAAATAAAAPAAAAAAEPLMGYASMLTSPWPASAAAQSSSKCSTERVPVARVLGGGGIEASSRRNGGVNPKAPVAEEERSSGRLHV